MRITEVLRRKGTDVVTVSPDDTVRQLVTMLREKRIGAAVVSRDGTTVEGIVSERDVVIALAERGAGILAEPISSISTSDVFTATLETGIEELMRLMTDNRIRHIPVVVDGRLSGIVSIGDVVKNRIVELETERSALTDYIATAR